MQGTWKTTGGGGPDPTVVIAIVALVLLFGGGTAVATAVTGLLIAVAVTVALVLVAAVVVLALWLHGKPAREARAREFYASRVRAFEASKQAAVLERHQRALELARATAPVITIDPAAIAVAVAGAQPQPVRVLRGQVER